MKNCSVLRAGKLEEEFASRIKNKRFQGRVVADPRPRDFKGRIEYTQCSETSRIRVHLVIWVQNIDKDPKKFDDRREAICSLLVQYLMLH